MPGSRIPQRYRGNVLPGPLHVKLNRESSVFHCEECLPRGCPRSRIYAVQSAPEKIRGLG